MRHLCVKGLIYKTLQEGLFVRSKSEGNHCKYASRKRNFTFIDAACDIVILEHLGMLHKITYKDEWEKKLTFYDAMDLTWSESFHNSRR
jgi:hypothetical protein